MGTLGRRRFFALVFAALAGASRVWARNGVAAAAGIQARSITPDQFLALSSRLLGREQLDSTLARIYLDPLLANPETATLLEGLIRQHERTAEHAALERNIIETWYTGVHEVDGVRQVATHRGALVWQVLGRPAPGTCAGVAGEWAQPPAKRP